MPLYEFGCGDHVTEAVRPIASRDEAPECGVCGMATTRIASLPQSAIVRAPGYSLRPGDRGFWDFDSPQGRLAPHERRRIAPDVAAEAYAKAPPQAVDPNSPVLV